METSRADGFNSLRKFVTAEIIFGVGSRLLSGQTAKKYGITRALVVSDPGVVAAGWTSNVVMSLDSVGVESTVFTGVTPNPRAEEVMSGVEIYHQNDCDGLIAVGGGSVIDCAKGIGIVAANGRYILEFEGADQVAVPMPPLVCVPTTGGTSADVSQFAIFTDLQEHRKVAILSKAVVPDVTLIDPETLTSLDAHMTACTGLDALVHAIEAFVSLSSSPLTDIHALHAIRLLNENLEASVHNLSDIDLRAKVMLASLEAGLAFSNASLGVNHAMAHSLGGVMDLPHGECNAIVLPHVIDFNFSIVKERFLKVGEALGVDVCGMSEKMCRRALVNRVIELRKGGGVERGLAQAGVSRSDIPLLSDRALEDICIVTNPRQAKKRDLEVIYEESI